MNHYREMGVVTVVHASNGSIKVIHHPAILHCNYLIGKKVAMIEDRWSLFEEDQHKCLSFRIENTTFSRF